MNPKASVVVIADIGEYWRVQLEFGPILPLSTVWRFLGISKQAAYQRFHSGKWRQVFVFGQCNVLAADLQRDGYLTGSLLKGSEGVSL